jgi:trigger factor
VNVTVETLGPCKKLMRVEVDVPAVDAAFEKTTKDFQKHAALPGFRPGKAPRDMVVKRYEKEILDEVKKSLIPDSYRKAVAEQKLEVVGYPDIEEIQFGRGQVLQFAATVETAPDFTMPEYKGLPVRRETATVSEADIDRALDVLRGQRARFDKVDRPVQTGDVAVVSFQGTCDGRPITDTAPNARGLTTQKNFWVSVEERSFIPGFAMQLKGARAGDHKTVTVTFPPDFDTPELAGRQGSYEVDVVEVKIRLLPALDEAFAKELGAESLERLRDGVRHDLQNELNLRQRRSIRNQLVRALLDRVTCDLPESSVLNETRNVVYDIVRENQQRGVTKEIIDQQKQEIYTAASHSARERVKAAFIFGRIAGKEGIRVDQQELHARVHHLAQVYQMPVAKFAKELEQRGGLEEVYEQLLNEKVLDFLQLNAKYEDVPAASAPTPEPAPEPGPAPGGS